VLRENPGDLTAARALGSLLEGKQRNTEALAVYLAVADARDRVPRDLMLRIARLQRKLGNRLEAIEWFQEALAEIWSSRQRTDLEIELAATQKEAGQFTDALASLAPVLEQENPPATAVLLAAGSATDSRQPALAVSYLDRLASIRLLTPSEEEWLAGQVRASGDRQRALLLYMRLASRPSPSAAVLEALGDVAEDGQDPSGALAALRRIEPGVRTPALLKKMMRVAIKAGNVEEAHGYLEAYRRAQPADAEVLLEHARLLAARQQNLAALESYQQFVNLRGTGNLSLELARAALAAKRYDLAAQWSRQAIQEGHNDRDTQVLLAESLYYGGRSKDANPLLRDLVTRAPEDARALELLAYTDIVLDRHLSAFRLLERAMRAQGTGIDRMLLQQGRSSFARGDHARSRSALERAHPEGEDVAGVAAGLADLDTAERPWLRLSASVFEDTNDIALDQAGAGVDFWPSSRGRVRVRARDGLLRQRALRFDRTAGAISYDQWFVKPELELAGTIGIENYSGAGDIVTGRVDARYYHQDRSESGARLRRESFYTVQDQGEQLPFSRVIDIGAIGPSFGHEEILAYHDKALPEDRRLRLELKGDAYDDGNHSAAIYTQYQIPLKPGSRNFTVIFPNLYAESFNRTVPGYFSPHAFVTGGVGFHAIRQNKDWNFELVLSPRAVSTNGVVDFGAHGFLALARRYRTFETGFEAFGVYDGTGRYTSARGLVHLSFRL
jgi:tetratricopeptide (TPR) repeat protein